MDDKQVLKLYELANKVIDKSKYNYSNEEKEDVTQELVLHGWKRIVNYKKRINDFMGFAYALMRDRLKDIERKEAKRRGKIQIIYTDKPSKFKNQFNS